jgi:osmotically-inducible protein OsmY
MKKFFTLITLASVTSLSSVSADQNCGSCNDGGGYYQQDQRQGPRGGQSYDRNQRNNDNNYGSQGGDNQKSASDREINKKIQDTLNSGWFSKGFQNVSFDVNNGNVTLRGSVDTLENKNKVEASVKKIDGVKQVNNQITISKESPDTYSEAQLQNSEKKFPQDTASNSQDRQLNAKIRDKLNNGWFSSGYETLVIKTANGVVIISGTVDKPEDVRKIGDQIKDVDGVRSVNNHLTVKNK